MGFVNKVMLMGNTTRAPQLRQLPSGTTICEFGLATNRIFKTPTGEERQETVFVDCTAFGRTAEIIAQYCPKGRSLFIEGRLHFETWEDAAGSRRSKLTIIVENVQFTGARDAAEPNAQPATLYQDMEVSRQAVVAKAAAVERNQLPPLGEAAPGKRKLVRRDKASTSSQPVAAPAASSAATAVASPDSAQLGDDLPF